MYIDVRIEERDIPRFLEIMSLLGANKEKLPKITEPIPEFPNLSDEEIGYMFKITDEIRKQLERADPTKPITFTIPPLVEVKNGSKKKV